MRRHPEPHVDPSRTHLNQILHGSASIQRDMEQVLEQYGIVDKRSVEGAEMILTAGVEYFDEICPGWRDGEYTEKFQQWVDLNVAWAKEKYGDGCVSMVLHMDETAPHIHLNLVPIATFEKKYRRGSKTVTKTHYSHHFNDPKRLIKQAREERNPELTKLGRLQTDYAVAMAPVGLVRGVLGSDRRHTTSEQHRRDIQRPVVELEPLQKEPVPEATVITALCEALGITTEREKIIALNKAERKRWIKQRNKDIQTLQAKAKEHDKRKAEAQHMTEVARNKDTDIKKLRSGLELSKAEIDALRKTDLTKVADKLLYEGDLIQPNGKPVWKGAIDMVKDVAGLDYEDAVTWLYHELGQSFTQSALTEQAIREAERKARKVAASVEIGKAERKLTKQEYAITQELAKQLDALNADAYRITCMSSDAPTYNVGKGKGPDGTERFYTRDEVLKQVPKLNYENGARGYNIFITPIDDTAHYILIDDMTDATLQEVKALGVSPCVTQYSSSDNIQAVIRITGDETLQPAANEYFKRMNAEYGDKNIQALRHPFRAVGFRNVKAKHMQADGRYPIVSLIQTAAQSCQTALRAVISIAKDLAQAKPKAVPAAAQQAMYEAILADDRDVDVLPDLQRIAVQKYKALAQQYGDEMNMSQADWMLCQDLLRRGYEPKEIAATIMQNSPNIELRHKKLVDYVNRTVSNAVDAKEKKDYK